MRTVNCILRSILVLILLWGMSAHAQMQGNKPYLYQANAGIDSNSQCSAVANCFNYPDPVAINDILAVGVTCDTPTTGPPFPIVDLLGNTFTDETAVSTGGGEPQTLQFSHSKATIAGTDYVHVTNVVCSSNAFFAVTPAAFKNLNGTLDGTIVTTHSSVTNSQEIMTASQITATNGEVAISFATMANGTGATNVIIPIGNTTQFCATDNPNNTGNIVCVFTICGAAGTTCTTSTASPGNSVAVMQTIFFETDEAIIDTQLPDCALNTPCAFTIHGVGGVAALACSITSGALPTGMSLGGTGNCTASGTPTTTLTASNITFQISDGTNTATKVLPFTVGTLFKPMSVVQTVQVGNASFADFSSNLTCGNTIAVCMYGHADTHIGSGFVIPVDGINNAISSTAVTKFNRVPSITGNRNGSLSCAVSTPVTTPATRVFFTQNQTSAYMLGGFMAEVQGQGIAEEGTFAHLDPSANRTSLSATFNAPVANMFDLAVTSSLGGSVSFSSVDSPFTNVYNGVSGNTFLFSDTTAQPSGNVTNKVNFSSTTNDMGTVVMGIRPRLYSNSCGETAAAVRHRVQIY